MDLHRRWSTVDIFAGHNLLLEALEPEMPQQDHCLTNNRLSSSMYSFCVPHSIRTNPSPGLGALIRVVRPFLMS